jgi:hypothetical protein
VADEALIWGTSIVLRQVQATFRAFLTEFRAFKDAGPAPEVPPLDEAGNPLPAPPRELEEEAHYLHGESHKARGGREAGAETVGQVGKGMKQ